MEGADRSKAVTGGDSGCGAVAAQRQSKCLYVVLFTIVALLILRRISTIHPHLANIPSVVDRPTSREVRPAPTVPRETNVTINSQRASDDEAGTAFFCRHGFSVALAPRALPWQEDNVPDVGSVSIPSGTLVEDWPLYTWPPKVHCSCTPCCRASAARADGRLRRSILPTKWEIRQSHVTPAFDTFVRERVPISWIILPLHCTETHFCL